MNLTDRTIKSIPAPVSGNRILYDDVVGGFGLRITANCAKAFILTYRIDGRQRRMTLGGWPDLTATAAREMALEARAAIAKGSDPLGIKEGRRNAPTINELCDDYLEHHARPHKRARSKLQDERAIDRFIKPRIGNLKVQAVTTRDIQDIHKALVSTPYQANRVLALLSKMMSLAVHWGWRSNNPVIGVKRYHEEAKEVALSVAESQRLMAAIEQYRTSKKQGSRTADAIEILLLTGARKNEVLHMRWSDLDLDSGVWIKPSAHTKQKKEHRVPLIDPVIDRLLAIKKKRGDLTGWVFPSDVYGQPMSEIKKGWKAILKLAEVDHLRIHDLRHSYATALVESGVSLEMVGRMLGHTQAATTRRYTHPGDDALRVVANKITARWEPVASSNNVLKIANG